MWIVSNDVVNTAEKQGTCPLSNMTIIAANGSRTVIARDRSWLAGPAGVENSRFFRDNAGMPFGEAKAGLQIVIT